MRLLFNIITLTLFATEDERNAIFDAILKLIGFGVIVGVILYYKSMS